MAGEPDSRRKSERAMRGLRTPVRIFNSARTRFLAGGITLSISVLGTLLMGTSSACATTAHAWPGGEKPSASRPLEPAAPPSAPPMAAPHASPPPHIAPPPHPAPAHVAQPARLSDSAPHPQPSYARPAAQPPARGIAPTAEKAETEPQHDALPPHEPEPLREPALQHEPAPQNQNSLPRYPAPAYAAPRNLYRNQYLAENTPRSAYGRSLRAQYRKGGNNGANNEAQGDHLPTWLRHHQNQSPAEQERALRQEPGFNRLSPEQQQERINTLHRLNDMTPELRELTLMRMENMERLSPQMRDAVRSSARQMADLPPDRKRLVQKAFRDLRAMPPDQRQEVMSSYQFASQFSAQERSIMSNLLAIEPYRRPAPPQ